MSDKTLIMVTVGPAYGPLTTFQISSRARESCPFFYVLQQGSMLPTTQVEPFRIVLVCLNRAADFEHFISPKLDTRDLLLFVKVWALAARLGLPALQNTLVSAFHVMINTPPYFNDPSNFDRKYPADVYVLQAIQHLRKEVGNDSHAEKFLVCLVGRTAPLIRELEKQLKRKSFPSDIKEKILLEVRAFVKDPIKHKPSIFRITTSTPPQYLPLEIRHIEFRNVRGRASPTSVLAELEWRGRIAQDRRKVGHYQASTVVAPQSSRASDATETFVTASEAPSHSRRIQSMVTQCNRWSEADGGATIQEGSSDHATLHGRGPPRDDTIHADTSLAQTKPTFLRTSHGSYVASQANTDIVAAPIFVVNGTPSEVFAQMGAQVRAGSYGSYVVGSAANGGGSPRLLQPPRSGPARGRGMFAS